MCLPVIWPSMNAIEDGIGINPVCLRPARTNRGCLDANRTVKKETHLILRCDGEDFYNSICTANLKHHLSEIEERHPYLMLRLATSSQLCRLNNPISSTTPFTSSSKGIICACACFANIIVHLTIFFFYFPHCTLPWEYMCALNQWLPMFLLFVVCNMGKLCKMQLWSDHCKYHWRPPTAANWGRSHIENQLLRLAS